MKACARQSRSSHARGGVAREALTITARDATRADIRAEAAAVRARLATLPLDDDERPIHTPTCTPYRRHWREPEIGAHSELERTMLFESTTPRCMCSPRRSMAALLPGAGRLLCMHCLRSATCRCKAISAGALRCWPNLLTRPCAALRTTPASTPRARADCAAGGRGRRAPAFDAYTHAIVDGPAHGVVDATEVVIGILINAVVPRMALTTDTIVYHHTPEQSMKP